MRHLPAFTTFLLLALLPRDSQAQSASAATACPDPSYECKDGACLLTLQFLATETCRTRIDDRFIAGINGQPRVPAPQARRVTEKTVLRVKVTRANHLRYALKVDTKEVVVESYVYLERLWKQIVGFGPEFRIEALPPPLTQEGRFIEAIRQWRAALAAKDDGLSMFVKKYSTLTLTPTQLDEIREEAKKVRATLTELGLLQAAASQAIWRSENYPIFDGTNALHEAVIGRLESFLVLAGHTVNGFTRRIEFGQAGRIVTVTITAADRSSSSLADETIVVEFLVHSTMPVTFHVGFSYRSVDEVRFEPIASAASTADGADLFSQIHDSEGTGDFTAFMSYDVCPKDRAALSWKLLCPQATLGTDFAAVGERLYLGASWRMGRTYLTVGAVSLQSETGVGDPVADTLGAAGAVTGSRELFKAISQSRTFGWFAGLSFAPF